MKVAFGALVCVVLAAGWVVLIESYRLGGGSPIHWHGFSSPAPIGGPSGIWLMAWTLTGISSRVLYDTVQRLPERRRSFSNVLRASLRDHRTWGALLVSPLVILLFYDALTRIDRPTLVALVSYQNGFFVKALFDIR